MDNIQENRNYNDYLTTHAVVNSIKFNNLGPINSIQYSLKFTAFWYWSSLILLHSYGISYHYQVSIANMIDQLLPLTIGIIFQRFLVYLTYVLFFYW